MEIVILGVAIIAFVFAVIFMTLIVDDCNVKINYNVAIGVVICFLLSTVCTGFFGYMIHNSKPQAIDVYRDKTTLEITFRDNIAIDSTVVFKTKN